MWFQILIVTGIAISTGMTILSSIMSARARDHYKKHFDRIREYTNLRYAAFDLLDAMEQIQGNPNYMRIRTSSMKALADLCGWPEGCEICNGKESSVGKQV